MAEEAGLGSPFLPSSHCLLCLCSPPVPDPCPVFLSTGPHPHPLPARFQQQPLIHDVLHAFLTSTPSPSQRHAAFSLAPFPTVHKTEKELQPARYLNAGETVETTRGGDEMREGIGSLPESTSMGPVIRERQGGAYHTRSHCPVIPHFRFRGNVK